jgi:hypothetical protein
MSSRGEQNGLAGKAEREAEDVWLPRLERISTGRSLLCTTIFVNKVQSVGGRIGVQQEDEVLPRSHTGIVPDYKRLLV